MKIWDRWINRQVRERVALAVRALDDPTDRRWGEDGANRPQDRLGYDRRDTLQEALEAWRTNPLARRIVGLMTQYVVGAGIEVSSPDPQADRFLKEWWNHRLNRMPVRVFEWCDELTRAGELFIVLSTDPSGMSYLRAIPASEIERIECAANDLDQEVRIVQRADPFEAGLEGRVWPVYDPQRERREVGGGFPAVIVHYAVNRVVGGQRGESDLAPLLRWLKRYTAWLEDRARLNRYRQSFLFLIQAKFRDAADRLQRQAELNAHPPNPGSILVADESEKWSVLAPSLASFESAEDGLALKKMVAVGSGNPLHFLAEPESSTRTTAESAGGPTFRHYQQRQTVFLWMVRDLASIALARRAALEAGLDGQAPVEVRGPDASSRDNEALARAAAEIVQAFGELRSRGLVDDAEYLRMVYRFAGEERQGS